MQTRRDQAQAYRFALARARTALINGEPDVRESLLRQSGTWTFIGTMLAVILVAGAGIFGLIRPGGKTGWDTPGALIVEKETGARFIYDPNDRRLHPVLNYTSARLILASATIDVRTFSRSSLQDAPRGLPRGQLGLPDTLPPPSGLVRGPWLVCRQAGTATQSAPTLTVSAGVAPSGQLVDDTRSVLVRSPDGQVWLVWRGHRLQVIHPRSALPALGYDTAAPLDVPGPWLNSLPPGPDLAAPSLIRIGTRVSYSVGDRQVFVGQVLKLPAEGGLPTRYYLTLDGGLAPISDTVALLLLADPDLRAAYGGQNPEAFEVAAVDVAPHIADSPVVPDGFPDQVPQLMPAVSSAGSQLCASYNDTSGSTLNVAVYLRDDGDPATSGAEGDTPQVRLPPGGAALIRLLPHAGQTTGSLFLVADSGAKYPVATQALTDLGFAGVSPVPLPEGIANLIPTGPALDPTRANADAPSAAVPAGTVTSPPAGRT